MTMEHDLSTAVVGVIIGHPGNDEPELPVLGSKSTDDVSESWVWAPGVPETVES